MRSYIKLNVVKMSLRFVHRVTIVINLHKHPPWRPSFWKFLCRCFTGAHPEGDLRINEIEIRGLGSGMGSQIEGARSISRLSLGLQHSLRDVLNLQDPLNFSKYYLESSRPKMLSILGILRLWWRPVKSWIGCAIWTLNQKESIDRNRLVHV